MRAAEFTVSFHYLKQLLSMPVTAEIEAIRTVIEDGVPVAKVLATDLFLPEAETAWELTPIMKSIQWDWNLPAEP